MTNRWTISFRCPDHTAAALEGLAFDAGCTRTRIMIHLIDEASAITSNVFKYPDILSMSWMECSAWEEHADQLEAALRRLLTGFARAEPSPERRPRRPQPMHGEHALNEVYRMHRSYDDV
jgi:hypothetical protein